MNSQETQTKIGEDNKNTEFQQTTPDTTSISSIPIGSPVHNNETVENMNEISEDGAEDIIDVDLSAVEIASPIDDMFNQHDPEFIIPDNINEAYRNVMSVCSANAQALKMSISEILKRREGVVITEVDPSTELQVDLDGKIADFEKSVSTSISSSCSKSDQSSENVEKKSKNIGMPGEKLVETTNAKAEGTLKEDLGKTGKKAVDVVAKIKETENITEGKKVIGKDLENPKDIEAGDVSDSNTDSSISETKSENLVGTKAKTGLKKSEKVKVASKVSATSSKPNAPSQQESTTSSLMEILKKAGIAMDDEIPKKQKNGSSKKRLLDQVVKSLGNSSTEEKLETLLKKHVDALADFHEGENRIKQLERLVMTQQREKEQLQVEQNRMILAKSRLESLCREMQRQSKAIKEESLLRIKEEEEKRKEVANKFQSTLNDISTLMQENSKRNIQLREENADLATKLKSLVDYYEIWEQNISKIIQQKELEAQLAKAKQAKINLLLKQETEKFLREKQSLLENMSDLQKRCTLLTGNELQLRTELAEYTAKYEEFQNVLTNSSKVFATFKSDMEKTSKKIKKLEKETSIYKQKWESSNKALLDMINHKEKQDKEFSNAQQRILTLEKLCRALQAERNELQNKLSVFTSSEVTSLKTEVPSLPTESTVV